MLNSQYNIAERQEVVVLKFFKYKKFVSISVPQARVIWFISVLISTVMIILISMVEFQPRGVGASFLVVAFCSFMLTSLFEKQMGLNFEVLPLLILTMILSWICGVVISLVLYYLIDQVWLLI